MMTAERKQELCEKTYFPVEKVKDEIKGGYYIRNGLTGGRIASVSKQYTLLPNERLIKPFMEHFGAERLESMRSYAGAKHYVYTFRTGREMNFGTVNGVEDKVFERLIIQNSYDKSRAFSFMFGAFRLVCTNGLYSGTALIQYRKIHVGEIPIDEMINQVLNNYHKNGFELWHKFRDKTLSVEQGQEIARSFQAYEVKDEEDKHLNERGTGVHKNWSEPEDNRYLNRAIPLLAGAYIGRGESVDNQRNGWGVFNQLNRAIAGKVDGKTQISKRIVGNKRAEAHVMKQLGIEIDQALNTNA